MNYTLYLILTSLLYLIFGVLVNIACLKSYNILNDRSEKCTEPTISTMSLVIPIIVKIDT